VNRDTGNQMTFLNCSMLQYNPNVYILQNKCVIVLYDLYMQLSFYLPKLCLVPLLGFQKIVFFLHFWSMTFCHLPVRFDRSTLLLVFPSSFIKQITINLAKDSFSAS
jgi:hypothetical protein